VTKSCRAERCHSTGCSRATSLGPWLAPALGPLPSRRSPLILASHSPTVRPISPLARCLISTPSNSPHSSTLPHSSHSLASPRTVPTVCHQRAFVAAKREENRDGHHGDDRGRCRWRMRGEVRGRAVAEGHRRAEQLLGREGALRQGFRYHQVS
jgi:hypothetical protein